MQSQVEKLKIELKDDTKTKGIKQEYGLELCEVVVFGSRIGPAVEDSSDVIKTRTSINEAQALRDYQTGALNYMLNRCFDENAHLTRPVPPPPVVTASCSDDTILPTISSEAPDPSEVTRRSALVRAAFDIQWENTSVPELQSKSYQLCRQVMKQGEPVSDSVLAWTGMKTRAELLTARNLYEQTEQSRKSAESHYVFAHTQSVSANVTLKTAKDIRDAFQCQIKGRGFAEDDKYDADQWTNLSRLALSLTDKANYIKEKWSGDMRRRGEQARKTCDLLQRMGHSFTDRIQRFPEANELLVSMAQAGADRASVAMISPIIQCQTLQRKALEAKSRVSSLENNLAEYKQKKFANNISCVRLEGENIDYGFTCTHQSETRLATCKGIVKEHLPDFL